MPYSKVKKLSNDYSRLLSFNSNKIRMKKNLYNGDPYNNFLRSASNILLLKDVILILYICDFSCLSVSFILQITLIVCVFLNYILVIK